MTEKFRTIHSDAVPSENRWTGLSRQEADWFRTEARKRGVMLPRNPVERVRMFFEWQGREVPLEILAATGRTRDVPYADPAAIDLAEKHKVNLALLSGTGAAGKITADDVREHLRQSFDLIASEVFVPSEQVEKAVERMIKKAKDEPESAGGDPVNHSAEAADANDLFEETT